MNGPKSLKIKKTKHGYRMRALDLIRIVFNREPYEIEEENDNSKKD